MIEELKLEDLYEAADVYLLGISFQIPPAYATLENIAEKLKKLKVFVYKEQGVIGLVSFSENKEINIDFICSLRFGEGIGGSLMRRVFRYAKQRKIKVIKADVSSIDERAQEFYHKIGFKKTSEKTLANGFKALTVSKKV
ncbi:MAG: GNAT family N-acetyltransferase [Candidatus Woesearchaeota archaeon]|nr:MAG: GNAT family N-acetyltransferase [Candidatus Woesearchaeota archaeon]